MQSTKSNLLALAAASIGLRMADTSDGNGLASIGGYGPFDVRPMRGATRISRPYGPGNYATTQRSRSKKYPEQSTRQELRSMRRQQGGPGLPPGAFGLLGEWGRMPTDIRQGDRLTFRVPRS